MKLSKKVSQNIGPIPSELAEEVPTVEIVDLSEFLSKDSAVSTLVFSKDLTSKQVIEQIIKGDIHHLVQWNDKIFFKQICTIKSILNEPQNCVQKGCHLMPSPLKFEIIEFSKTTDKEQIREKILNFAEGLHSAVSESLNSIFDELYMNATLDAPAEAIKKGLSSAHLQSWKSEFILEMNDDFILLSCRDPFGSLDTEKFLKRMDEVYQKGAGEAINHGVGGAGLGCVILFEHSLSLILAVEPEKVTCVGALVPKKMNHKLKAGLRKSLHRIKLD